MNLTTLPFIIKAFCSSSTLIVPLKRPCTESFLISSALFSKSLLDFCLVTTALSFKVSPAPLSSNNNLVISLPIRPKPNKTKSCGFSKIGS